MKIWIGLVNYYDNDKLQGVNMIKIKADNVHDAMIKLEKYVKESNNNNLGIRFAPLKVEKYESIHTI